MTELIAFIVGLAALSFILSGLSAALCRRRVYDPASAPTTEEILDAHKRVGFPTEYKHWKKPPIKLLG